MEFQGVTKPEALEIARREIERLIGQSAELSQHSFGDVGFLRENELMWTFASGSEELIEQGFVPGAVIVSVDKTDGHIWSRDEMESYAHRHQQISRVAQATV